MKKTVEVSPQDARGKKRKKPALALAAGLVFLVLLGVGGWVYVDGLAYKTVRVEAGVTVTASDFLKRPDKDAVFAEGSQPFDIAVPGIYQVIVKSGLFAHKCTLVIEDTIAPKAESGGGLSGRVFCKTGGRCHLCHGHLWRGTGF